MKWWYGVIIIMLVAAGYGIWRVASVTPPGMKMADQGREHVSPQQVAEFSYNSNPPTSGPHLATWVKAGVFSAPQSEGELIHSLEHGYIIISYNCNVHLGENSKIAKVFAHEEEGSPSADFKDPTISTGSAINETEVCKTLINQLKELSERKKLWKLIVVPRPALDTTIALTAWEYIDKFDPDPIGIDAKRIERFIDFHRDQGPEKTME